MQNKINRFEHSFSWGRGSSAEKYLTERRWVVLRRGGNLNNVLCDVEQLTYHERVLPHAATFWFRLDICASTRFTKLSASIKRTCFSTHPAF